MTEPNEREKDVARRVGEHLGLTDVQVSNVAIILIRHRDESVEHILKLETDLKTLEDANDELREVIRPGRIDSLERENAELREALSDIAHGQCRTEVSLEQSPEDFRQAMWMWSQKRAKSVIERQTREIENERSN